ncbi:MAG: HAD-IB family phosphatase [Gammaproteobacteria bacterium]|nr:HAD-IB family phosphatase [Gammaproteobacteria bacterium]
MRLAIFDIDGVLVRRSSERAFWKYLLHHKRQRPRQLLSWLLCLFRYLPAVGVHAVKMNKSYLAGLDRRDVETLAESFAAEWAPRNWYEPAVRRLEEHQLRGDTVVLLSGTLEPLASSMAALLRVRYVIGTLPAHRNGIYLASLPALHPFSSAKLVIADKLLRELGADWSSLTAYGDSYHDLALLDAAGEAVAVRPDRRLRGIALARNWAILETD